VPSEEEAMASDLRIRASDADRDAAAAALREHLAAGRLTTEEFDERLDKAYAAKTLGDLDDLMADLPATDPGPLPGTSVDRFAARPPLTSGGSARPVDTGPGRYPPAWRAALGSWVGISLVLLAIWLVSGAGGGLWFLWVAAALGVLILARQVRGTAARAESRPARRRHHHRHHGD
jgi:DUF1707 SHOCT-like domain